MESIGERLRIIRKTEKLTLEDFGKRLGAKKSTISQLENGKNNLTEQMKVAICKEYNVNREWLENGTGEMFLSPSDDIGDLISEIIENKDEDFYKMVLELVRTYQQLSPDSKKVLIDFARKYQENTKEN